MEFIEGFVSTGSPKVEPILSFGDLLTVERQINAQEDRRNSKSSKGRLEDVIPCLSDFHFLGNFFEVMNTYHMTHFKTIYYLIVSKQPEFDSMIFDCKFCLE